MEPTDYFNHDFYSGEYADLVTNCSSNSVPKQGFMREIMARPMIKFPNIDKAEENEQNSNDGRIVAESVRKKMVFG